MNNFKLSKKITIILIFLMIFNFIIPTYSNAGLTEKLVNPIKSFVIYLGDGVYSLIQKVIIGDGQITEKNGSGTFSRIKYTPDKIFANQYPIFNVNFFNANESNSTLSEKVYNTVMVYKTRQESPYTKEKWESVVKSIEALQLLVNTYLDLNKSILEEYVYTGEIPPLVGMYTPNVEFDQNTRDEIAEKIRNTYIQAPKDSALYNAYNNITSEKTTLVLAAYQYKQMTNLTLRKKYITLREERR